MPNLALFSSRASRPADVVNAAGGRAYRRTDEQALAQYVATGCFAGTYYTDAATQLDEVLALAKKIAPAFVAQAAVYARREARMKDAPALLLAHLSVTSPELFQQGFPLVIDSARMLRTFVQIMRSGVVGRRSLGSLPKRLIKNWIEVRSDRALLAASVGNAPSLADVVRMVHPSPASRSREAFYGWLLGRPHSGLDLPGPVHELLAWRADPTRPVPDVPFNLLTSESLDAAAWTQIALQAPWNTLRMNLNTLARNDVFANRKVVKAIAKRLADEKAVRAAQAFPYQLFASWKATRGRVPTQIGAALEAALEVALTNVPRIAGNTWICVDTSGSMHSSITGQRSGASSAVTCLDVAALFASAILRTASRARVLTFTTEAQPMRFWSKGSVLANAERLANAPCGGTDCAAPLRWLNAKGKAADTVILISDNESWVGPRRWFTSSTGVMDEFRVLKRRNPAAKLVCLDLQPSGNSQADESADVLNIGGFSDQVFKVIETFVSSGASGRNWVEVIREQRLDPGASRQRGRAEATGA